MKAKLTDPIESPARFSPMAADYTVNLARQIKETLWISRPDNNK